MRGTTFLSIVLVASLIFALYALSILTTRYDYVTHGLLVVLFLFWPFAIVALVGAIVGFARLQHPTTRAGGVGLILLSSPMIAVAVWSLFKGQWNHFF
jgi:hypothetical protein